MVQCTNLHQRGGREGREGVTSSLLTCVAMGNRPSSLLACVGSVLLWVIDVGLCC